MATLVFKMLDNKKPLPVYLQHSFTFKNILFTFKHTYKQMSYFTLIHTYAITTLRENTQFKGQAESNKSLRCKSQTSE